MDARTITVGLNGKWQGRYGLCRCPVHADRTPSLKISDDPRKEDGVDVHCFSGCQWRDVKAELVKLGLLPEFKPGAPIIRARAPIIDQGVDDEKRTELPLKIWDAAIPMTGTLGWRYFTECRGLYIEQLGDLSDVLRFHEGFRAVIALMTDPISNEPCGIHRTFLNNDASKDTSRFEKGKAMLGRAGVVRLSPDEDVLEGLGITEGIEDALAVLISGWTPVWAATSAGAIKIFPVIPGIEALTIFRDDNAVGIAAAQACGARWHNAGREVFLASLREQL